MMDDVDGADARSRRRNAQKSKSKYMNMLQDVVDRKSSQVLVDLDDLQSWEANLDGDDAGLNLVSSIERNAHHYIEILSRAVDSMLPQPTTEPTFKDDVLDIIMSQRSKRNDAVRQQMDANIDGRPA